MHRQVLVQPWSTKSLRNHVAKLVCGGAAASALLMTSSAPNAATAPRAFTPDDFLGVWIQPPADDATVPKELKGTPWAPEPAKMFTPWGAEQSKKLATHATPGDCDPWGPLVGGGTLFPIEFSKTANGLMISYEVTVLPRRIYMDGRKHPADLDPSWMGHSVGHWEGSTLVVDTIGSNGRTRPINGYLDGTVYATPGSFAPRLPQSDKLHVMERYRLVADGHFLEDELTVEDPKSYTGKFTSKRYWERRPDLDFQEYYCSENERRESEGQNLVAEHKIAP